jgi:glutathione S-transferase
MKLYGSRNSRSLRCAWALEEAGASYDYQRIWMMKGEGHSPSFKAINPSGKIPVLVDGDLTLTESAAILMYVADKFPSAMLMPTEAAARAEVFRWMFYVVTEVEPHLWAIAQHRFALPEDKRVPAVEPTLAWQLQRSLRAIEKAVAAHPFVAGGTFSAADILTTHCLTWTLSAKLEGLGEASLAYIERMKARPAFQRAVDRENVEAERHEAAWQASAQAVARSSG